MSIIEEASPSGDMRSSDIGGVCTSSVRSETEIYVCYSDISLLMTQSHISLPSLATFTFCFLLSRSVISTYAIITCLYIRVYVLFYYC